MGAREVVRPRQLGAECRPDAQNHACSQGDALVFNVALHVSTQSVTRHKIHISPKQVTQFTRKRSHSNESYRSWQRSHNVDITLRAVFAASNAPENGELSRSIFLGDSQDRAAALPNSSAHLRVREPSSHSLRGLQCRNEVETRRLNQTTQRAQRRFPTSAFIGTDHALRDTRSLRQFSLRQVHSAPSFTQEHC